MPWPPSALAVTGWDARAKTPPEVTERIVAERAAGKSMRAIAEALTAEGVQTVRGAAAWSISTVQAVLRSQDAAKMTETG